MTADGTPQVWKNSLCMPSQATYEDVNLVLRLYELRREETLRNARAWFTANFRPKSLDEFNKLCPAGSQENAYFRMVTSYWDMVASFVTSNVLNKDLFFESGGELLIAWLRLKPFVAELRDSRSNPAAYRNLETVATDYAAHMNQKAPGAYEAFAKRVG